MITNFPACALQQLRGRTIARAAPDGVPDIPACPQPETASAPATPVSFDRPRPETCAALRPARWAPATGPAHANGSLRVVAPQHTQTKLGRAAWRVRVCQYV